VAAYNRLTTYKKNAKLQNRWRAESLSKSECQDYFIGRLIPGGLKSEGSESRRRMPLGLSKVDRGKFLPFGNDASEGGCSAGNNLRKTL
jgi:hypothetical protein